MASRGLRADTARAFAKTENIFRILLSNGADVDAENDAKLSARKYCEGRYTGVKNASKLAGSLRNLSLKFDLRD